MSKVGLICGVSGQDGAYLARHLLSKGYRVIGTSRDAELKSFENLKRLEICQDVETISMAPIDFRSVLETLDKTSPDEVYNLSGQSSVGLSIKQPVETLESISLGSLNLLEAIRFLGGNIKLYNAGSGECFGSSKGPSSNESTPFRPSSPYAVAKAAAFWQVVNYREAYGLFACSGILFNHESPLRPERFVTRKVISAAARISAGSREKLVVGDLSIERDWGWSPEYVVAMQKILERRIPKDYVIATGETHSLSHFVDAAFTFFGLKWQDHVSTDPSLIRPSEIYRSAADPSLAYRELGWVPDYKMQDVVRCMCEVEAGVRKVSDT